MELNKACPKNSFLLPRINQLVDATIGHALLIFMDTYSSYNQIPMYVLNEEHTSFITNCRLYFYKVMPFSLKNAGTTYQWLFNMMFADQICKTMKVYVHDMLVKSQTATNHVADLTITFNILQNFPMKLN